jgi:glutathione S-transferase
MPHNVQPATPALAFSTEFGTSPGRDFILGKRPTIADLSMCGYLFYGDELGLSLEPYAHMRAWLERIRALPGWKGPYELMPKRG